MKNLLVMDFAEKKKVAALFPPFFIDMSTSNSVKWFQLYINNMIVNTNDVYTYCSLFILFETGTLLTKVYL